MPTDPEPPLEPPPRKVHLRRGVRNLRRAYRSVFVVIVIIMGGWAAIDAFRWNELPDHHRWLDIGFGIAALVALIVWRLVERPLGRQLRLGRIGLAAQAIIHTIGKPRGRRHVTTIAYAFQTASGGNVTGECALPRRFPAHTLAPGIVLEVLYDPGNPQLNKPRLALEYIEFDDPASRERKRAEDGASPAGS